MTPHGRGIHWTGFYDLYESSKCDPQQENYPSAPCNRNQLDRTSQQKLQEMQTVSIFAKDVQNMISDIVISLESKTEKLDQSWLHRSVFPCNLSRMPRACLTLTPSEILYFANSRAVADLH